MHESKPEKPLGNKWGRNKWGNEKNDAEPPRSSYGSKLCCGGGPGCARRGRRKAPNGGGRRDARGVDARKRRKPRKRLDFFERLRTTPTRSTIYTPGTQRTMHCQREREAL